MSQLSDYPDANWLEETRYAERYDLGDGESAWFCRDCGARIEGDETEGCDACAYGMFEEEEE